MTTYTNPLDIGYSAIVRTMGYRPYQSYYNKEPVLREAERYKYFPMSAPLSTEAAEAGITNSVYQTTHLVEIGDNYQFKLVKFTKWKASYVVLTDEQKAQLRPLENGVYFYTLDINGDLHALASADEALSQLVYLRVTKEMGKIISVEKRRAVSQGKIEFDYWENGNLITKRVEEYNVNGELVRNVVSEYDKEGEMLYFMTIQATRTTRYEVINDATIYSKWYFFDEAGVTTNEVISYQDEHIENRILDANGDLIRVDEHWPSPIIEPDFPEPEQYQLMPLDPVLKHYGQ